MQKNGFIALMVVAVASVATLGIARAEKEEAPNPAQKAPAFESAGAGIEWLGRELKLTDDQKAQLAALHRDLELQANAIRQDSRLSPSEKEVRMHALHEGLGTRLKAVLTADQNLKLDQMGGWNALAGGPRAGEAAGPSIEALERELKLTDAQKEQLAAVHRDFEQQANDIRQDNLLSPADKEARIHALHENLPTRIKALLTSDQIQKFDQMGGMKVIMHHASMPAGIVIMKENGLDRLGLTGAQKAAIEGIAAQEKLAFVSAGGEVTKLRLLKQAHWQRILAILTPEQQKKLAEAQGIALKNGPNDGSPEGHEPGGK